MAEKSMTFSLFGKDVSASKAFTDVGHSARRMGEVFAGVSAAGVVDQIAGKVVDFAKESVDKFGEVGGATLKLQRVMGGSAQDVSRLASAFNMTGVDSDVAGKAIAIFSKHLATNDKTAKSLGMSFKDAHGNLLPMTQILPELADRFSKLPAGPARTALAMQLFGKAGTQMLPFLAKGKEGIKGLMEESDKLGTTLSGKDLAAIKANTLAKRKFGEALAGVQITIGKVLFPILTKLMSWFVSTAIPVIGKVTTWVMKYLGPAFAWLSTWITKVGLPMLGKLFDMFMKNVWPAIKNVAGIIAQNLQPAIVALGDFWTNTLVPGVKDLIPILVKVGRILGIVGGVILVVASWIIGKLAPVLFNVLGGAIRFVIAAWGKYVDAITWVIDHMISLVQFFQNLPAKISSAVSGLWNGLTTGFKAAINTIIGWWNNLHFSVPKIDIGPVHVGGGTIDFPNVPYLASGGIVSRPTLAMIGERGPEAVVPLNRYGSSSGNGLHVHVHTSAVVDNRGMATLMDTAFGVAKAHGWKPRTVAVN